MNLLPAAAAFVVGIYCASYIPVFIVIVGGAAGIVICVINALRGQNKAVDMAAVIIMFIVGCTVYNYNISHHSNEFSGKYITVYGRISELPSENSGLTGYIVEVREVEYDGSRENNKFRLRVTSDKSFRCGDCVAVHGKLEEFNDKTSEFAFDSKQYYAARSIYSKMYAINMEPANAEYKLYSPAFISNMLRQGAADIISSKYTGDPAAAMIAVITGDKHRFSDTYGAILNRTSTKHLYYPAFAHVALIMSLVNIFSAILHRKYRDYIIMLLLGLYLLFNAGNYTVIKCAALAFTMLLSKRLFGVGDRWEALSVYIIALGFINPLILMDSSVVFSCTVTIIFNCSMETKYKRYGFFKKHLRRYLLLVLTTAPISAYYFGGITLYSYFASLIFIPLITVIIIISPLFLLGCVFPAAYPFAWTVHKLIMVLLHIPVLIDKLPFSVINLTKPSPIFIAAFYTGAAALWYANRGFVSKRNICAVISAGLSCAMIITAADKIGKLELNFIDVGQGDAALIHVPFSGNIIIDGGGSPTYSTYNIGENVFVPYLEGRGAGIIQAAVVSHYHKDHTEGIVAAIKNTRVLNLIMPNIYPENELRMELEAAAKENNTKIWYISKPTSIKMDEVIMDIYPPDESVTKSGDVNASSLMVNLRYGSFNCVFTGDMTTESEAYMLRHSFVPEAEILKAGHHGSLTSNSQEFIDAVNPQTVLIGAGTDNEYGLPKDEVLQRFSGARILRTDINGDIRIFADKEANLEITTRY